MPVDHRSLISIAESCVDLVQSDFGVTLDWTTGTIDALDRICEQLTADGPLTGERLELWWRLLGAYVGEVVVRAYDGRWTEHEKADGAYAVTAMGITGFPFSTVARVLEGEAFKSLASFIRGMPAIASRA